jgi:hypothetical protein
MLSGLHSSKRFVSSKGLGVSLLNQGWRQFKLGIWIAYDTSIFIIDEGEGAINCNVSPD